MLKQLSDFFAGNFMAHGYCFLWKPELVGLHAVSDFIIALSYYSIPILLVYFVRRRHDLPFQGIFLLFSAFILSCGTGHLLELWTLWHPHYWLSGLIKAITAVVSLYTVFELVPLMPKALALASPAQLEAANFALEKEIAEHKQTVEALKQSQQRLSLLVQQTPLAVIEWNLNGEVREWNPAAETIFGYKKHEAMVHQVNELMMPDFTQEQSEQVWQDLLMSHNGSCISNQYTTPDRRIIFCEWYNIPLIEPNGSCVGVASLVQDVTQRREAEQALLRANEVLEQRVQERTQALAKANEVLQAEIIERQLTESALWQSETRLHTVVTQAPIILYATDSNGKLTLLEGKGLERLGHPPGKGIEPLDLERYGSQLKILENLQDIFAGKDSAWTVKVGDSVYQNRATPLRDKQEQVIGLIGVATDITELKQVLHQLKQTQAQLVQSEKMSSLGMMVAGIAHEINNPVGFVYSNLAPASEYIQLMLELINLYQKHYPTPVPAIQDYTEAIELDFLMQDLPKLLASMKVGAERIRNIITSLRTFSRIDEAEMKPVDIHAGIDSTLLLLQHRLKEKSGHQGIEVVKKYGALPLVECYLGQINQVFMNILVNAIDALESRRVSSEQGGYQSLISGPAPQIQIWTEIQDTAISQDAKTAVIRIRDNGPGMTQRVQQLLFDPFFTTKPVGKGTGLGLSISYEIVVAKHGGQLHCISTLGEGTEFIIQIPIEQPKHHSRISNSTVLDSQLLIAKQLQLCETLE